MKVGDKVYIKKIEPCRPAGTRFIGSLRPGDNGEINGISALSCGCSKGKETYRVFKPNTIIEKGGLTVNGYCYLRNEFRELKMDSIKSAWLLGDAE